MAATIQTIEKPTKARALDTSGNNNHGQIYSGRALEFDGVSDSLEGVDNINTSYGITNNVTIACWIKTPSFAATQFVFNLYANTGDAWGTRITTSGNIHIFDDIDGGDDMYYETRLDTDTWYRVVTIMDNYEQKLYINGVLVGSGSNQGTINSSGPAGFDSYAAKLYIGRRGYSAGELYFNGAMSDFQMWDSVWTAEDILYDYNNPEQLALNRGGTSLANSNLKLWYPMNDGHRGQQSYILDASNTGLGDELLTTTDLTTVGNQTIAANSTLNGWTHHATYQYDSVTASSDGIRIVSNGSNDLGSAYQSVHSNSFVATEGVTYRLEYTAIKNSGGNIYINVQNNPVGSSLMSSGSNEVSNSVTNEVIYFTADGSSDLTNFVDFYTPATRALDWTISYVSIKPVNDKNHATTVFYGDEKVANGDMNVTDPATVTIGGVAATIHDATFDDSTSITDHTDTDTNNKTIKVTGDSSSQYPLIRWSDGSNMGLVTGRTYYVEVWVYIPSSNSLIDKVQLKVMDNAASTELLSNVTTTTDTWTKLSGTFVDDDIATINIVGIDTDGSSGGAQDFSSEVFYIDDLSVKEVGIASGWTDADQQLDIPQTALQSYNQLAWFSDNEGNNNPHASASHHDDFNPGTGDFTVSVWVFQSDTIDDNYLFAKGGGGASGWHLRIDPNGDFDFAVEDDDGSNNGTHINANAALVISPGKWYHCVAVINRTADNTYLYLNGELVETEDISALNNPITHSSGTLKLGSWGTTYSGGTMNGTATEFSIFKGVALNQSQVNELYNDGKALDALTHSQSSYLKGYWRNNGLAVWQDLTSYNRDVTLANGSETMLITAGADGSRDSQGFLMNRQRLTNSLNLPYFTASDGYVMSSEVEVKDLGDNFDFGTSHFSVSAWIKKYLSDKAGYIVTCQNTGYQNMGFHIRITANNDLAFVVGDGSNFYSITHDTNLDDGEWHNVVGVYTATTGGTTQGAAIYIDGIYKGRDHDGTELGAINTSSGVRIGGKTWSNIDSNSTQMYDGQIDDVLIYKGKALDDGLTSPSIGDTAKGEIARNYNAGKRSHR